jgi:hypothetical protein
MYSRVLRVPGRAVLFALSLRRARKKPSKRSGRSCCIGHLNTAISQHLRRSDPLFPSRSISNFPRPETALSTELNSIVVVASCYVMNFAVFLTFPSVGPRTQGCASDSAYAWANRIKVRLGWFPLYIAFYTFYIVNFLNQQFESL